MRRGGFRILLATAALAVTAGAITAVGPVVRPAPAGPAVMPRASSPVAARPAAPSPAPPAAASAVPTAAHATAPTVAARTHAPARDTGCVIVSLKRSLSDKERRALGLGSASRLRGSRLLVAQAPEGVSATDFSARLESSGVVDYAEPDHLLEPAAASYTATPNDPDFRSDVTWDFTTADDVTTSVDHAMSWALRGAGSANFDQVWPALATAKAGTEGERDVRVAVIDTGFYFVDNTDLGANILPAIDECQSYSPLAPAASRITTDTDVTPVGKSATGDVAASAAHGTMVASEIGQGTNNGVGSAGAAYDTRVDIYKVQGVATATFGTVHKGDAVIPDSAIVRAIYDAVDDAHAKGYRLVINMSLVEVSGDGSTAIRNAIEYARRPDHDVVVVAAAGNEGADGVSYPAAYPGVIAVGSLSADGNRRYRSSFSNYGAGLDILAPGEDIWGPTRPNTIKTLPGSPEPDPYGVPGYDWWNGTSMAAPYVSAAAALLLRVEPSLTATEVETYLTRNAVDMGYAGRDDTYGWGRLDAYAAYRALVTPVTTADTRDYYSMGSTLALSVSDRDSGTDVTTYHLIDGSPRWDPLQGLTVNMPVSGAGWHSLEYWSVDSNGVTEAVHKNWFHILTPDAVPPVTSSDATGTYAGAGTIDLSAVDPSPGWSDLTTITLPWATRTFYRLDAGPATTGNVLTVGSPGSHTLQFWSADYAGNVEAAMTSTFTVTVVSSRASIARNTSSVRRGAHVHLTGTLSPARSGDTVIVWVRYPGSSKYTKSYKRTVTSVSASGKGTWQSLTYTPTRRGRYYFRVVFSGDSRLLSRTPYTSGSVWVNVR